MPAQIIDDGKEETQLTVQQFNGMRNDMSQKNIPPEFWYNVDGFNQDNITGMNQMLFPSVINSNTGAGYGGYEYRYNDASNVLHVEQLAVFGSTLYKGAIGTRIAIQTGLKQDDYTLLTFNDKAMLFCEGQIPKYYNGVTGLVYDMGAPWVQANAVFGNLVGSYRYQVSFVTAGGEETTGALSNIITAANKTVTVNLPIGYTGTLQRKIYRTTGVNSNYYYLVATVADNTTLTYLDNIADATIQNNAQIPSTINNGMPKPKFGDVQYNRLCMTGDPQYPTQAWFGEFNKEVIDLASFTDISNIGNDNTPTMGLCSDVGKMYVFTKDNAFIATTSTSAVSINAVRGNVGATSGYSLVNVPQNGEFPNGVLYLSSDLTMRMLSGIFSSVLANSIDNINSDNYGQYLLKTLKEFNGLTNTKAIFYDFKYHIASANKQLVVVYDIRTKSFFLWRNGNVRSWAVYNGKLYALTTDGNVELWYSDVKYRGKDVVCTLETPYLFVDNNLKLFKTIRIWLKAQASNTTKLQVIVEDDYNNPIVGDIAVKGGDYSIEDYSQYDYNVSQISEDFREMYINRWGRWMKFILQSTSGRLIMQKYQVEIETVLNKEG